MADLPDDPAFRRRLQEHRESWQFSRRPPRIETPGPGQESVWDYPRPPEVREAGASLKVVFAGEVIAATDRGLKVVETAGAPVYHFPADDVREGVLHPSSAATFCEWKGEARYFDVVHRGKTATRAAYTYPDPLDDLGQGYGRISGMIVFYADPMDEVWVGDERATPQPGGYYAGWVTSKITGPIKGAPGSEGW
ncbi:DUF427 domain-containing protein [Parvularcula sp. ZS-1/3]|uniref:DUF427 domain-containing protein n=1 Tax=Parvularcula mediterranea TaxID=2732508 RepID=A0A7Y3RND7_9PROT|nr:DUF427 domain-containing protein [Parvularcula mediterranea]NNU17239.1 DUF427 domain-containing protein [Parvularcula mediterranea]